VKVADQGPGYRQKAGETKRQRTRERIITATLGLYGPGGERDFPRSKIAKAAGVGIATLFNHFPSNYDLLTAAYERLLSPVVDPILAATAAGTYDPPDVLDELVRYVYTVARVSKDRANLVSAISKEARGGRSVAPLKQQKPVGQNIVAGLKCIEGVSPGRLEDADEMVALLLVQVVFSLQPEYPYAPLENSAIDMMASTLAPQSKGDAEEWGARLERVHQAVDESGIIDACATYPA
jgi:AcrR family transcriptional regulator